VNRRGSGREYARVALEGQCCKCYVCRASRGCMAAHTCERGLCKAFQTIGRVFTMKGRSSTEKSTKLSFTNKTNSSVAGMAWYHSGSWAGWGGALQRSWAIIALYQTSVNSATALHHRATWPKEMATLIGSEPKMPWCICAVLDKTYFIFFFSGFQVRKRCGVLSEDGSAHCRGVPISWRCTKRLCLNSATAGRWQPPPLCATAA
jgi:hypothetical protein